jgi:DNA-binding transcriptional LysR family regulator
MAQWAAEVDRAADSRETAPSGVVRITAPAGVAFDIVAPFAAWLRTKLPQVRLEVLSTVRFLDLGRREADLALRFEAPEQRDVVSLAIIETDAGARDQPPVSRRARRERALRSERVARIAYGAPGEAWVRRKR